MPTKENTLGAPTEGLGQTVTFTAGGQAGVPQMQPVQRGVLRTEQRGGEARNTARGANLSNASQLHSAMVDTLTRLGGEILAPHIKRARTEAFVGGMQRAASGMAVKEIVEEQPWYAGVFGDTPAVEGARVYAGFAKSQEIATQVEADMPNLRKLSPDAFQKQMAERLGKLDSGDKDEDLLVAQGLIREMPGLMKRHTKEHIGWQQDNLSKAQQGAQAAAASRYASVAAQYRSGANKGEITGPDNAGPFVDENDLLESKLQFIESFRPAAGIPLDTHNKVSTASIGQLLAQKNLHSYYVLEDAGVIESLGPENSKRLREQADRVEARTRAEMPEDMVAELANVKALVAAYDRKGVREELPRRIKNLNDAFKARTGAREPLLSGNTQAELVSSLIERQVNAERSVREAWAKKAESAAEGQKAVYGTVGMLMQGQNINGVPADAKRAAWASLHVPGREAALAQARVLQHQQGTYDDEGRGYVRVRGDLAFQRQSAPQWEELYQRDYLPMVKAANGSESAALAYFGDFGKHMSFYHSRRANLTDPAAIEAAFLQASLPMPKDLSTAKGSVDQAVKAAVGKRVSSTYSSESLFKSDRLRPEFHGPLAARLLPVVERFGTTTSVDDRVDAALNDAKRRGLEIAGGYYWDTAGGPSLVESLNRYGTDNIPLDKVNAVVESSIEHAKKTLGLESAQPIYYNDNGVPTLRILGETKDKQWRAYPLTLKDMHDNWKAGRVKTPTSFGPAYTGLTAPAEQPSIYASQEEWAAYRQSQAAKAK